MNFTRRRLLQGLSLLGAGSVFRNLAPAFGATSVTPGQEPFLIVCTFDGGWDQLLALDPRSSTAFTSASTIHPAYDLVEDAETQAVLASTGGTGLVTPAGSAISFGPAVGKLSERYADLCVVRGVDMGTLTHEVGRRYFLTGKFPRGLQASGSALATAAAAGLGDLSPIPNLVVGGETYNEGMPNYASGLSIRRSTDLLSVLTSLGKPLPGGVASAIDAYHASEKCSDILYDGNDSVTTWLDSRAKAQVLASGDLGGHFDFSKKPDAEIAALYAAFGIDPDNLTQLTKDLAGPKSAAMIAAQAITKGVSQCVSVPLAAVSIDDHDDSWASDHALNLRAGFDALADLIGYLKATKDGNGTPFFDRTVILVTSDFARTPKLNSRGGRDHHLASSCLLAGRGIRGNTVLGATRDDTFRIQPIDPATGKVAEGGVLVRPPDIHATLLTAAGLSYEHISNQSPVVLGAALTG